MELLIAIAGLIIYGALIGHGKAQEKAFNRNFEERLKLKKSREERWLAKVFDVTKLHEAWEYADDNYASQPYILAQAYAKLPSYADMTEREIEQSISLYRRASKNLRSEVRNRFLMWHLAQQGKIECSCDIKLAEFVPAFTEREKREWDRSYEFIMLILGEIRKVAPETRVIFTPPYAANDEETTHDAERDINTIRYRPGELHWLQLSWYNDDLKKF